MPGGQGASPQAGGNMEVMDGGQVGADRRGWIGGNVDSTTARSRLPAGIDKLTVTLFEGP